VRRAERRLLCPQRFYVSIYMMTAAQTNNKIAEFHIKQYYHTSFHIWTAHISWTTLYPLITYYWTGLLILDQSYLLRNLTNSKMNETKALEPLEACHFCISNFRTC
jgi:hypothetical protein